MSKPEDRHPKKFRKACAALEACLNELFKITDDWKTHVYAWLSGGDGFRIAEISFTNGSSGNSFQRNLGGAVVGGLILACEQFVLTYRIKAYRPEGWESDLDEHGDAKEMLATIVKDEFTKTTRPRRGNQRGR